MIKQASLLATRIQHDLNAGLDLAGAKVGIARSVCALLVRNDASVVAPCHVRARGQLIARVHQEGALWTR